MPVSKNKLYEVSNCIYTLNIDRLIIILIRVHLWGSCIITKFFQANSHRKVVDTEDVHNISRRNREGKVTSETVRTEKHEVYDDKEAPDDGTSYDENDSENRSRNYLEHDSEKYRCTKTDKFTDYYKVLRN